MLIEITAAGESRLMRSVFAVLDVIKRLLLSPDRYARSIGVKVGKRCVLSRSTVYSTEPYLVEIGDHVLISQNVSFLAHDGGVWVFRDEMPKFDVLGRIKVGSNTYIGFGVTILLGVTIGKNCVIGAGSLVTKSIPDNTVVAGVPCRFVCTVNEYKERMLRLSADTGGLREKQKRRILEHLQDDRLVKKEQLRVAETDRSQ